MPINTRLKELEDEGNPIRVGVIGAGAFGSMVISQLTYTKGMTPAIVADVKLENALRAFEISGIDHTTIVHAKDVSEADSAIDDKRPVVTSDGCLLVESDVDVVVEATGIVDAGAEYAFRAIMNRKHVVMVNVEADVLVGPFLKKLADNAGVIYSLAYGDQPALVKELYDWADMLGLDIVAGGKGARYRADFRKGTPDDALIRYGFSSDRIESVDLNPKMYNSFLDGTKSTVEMASVSNMTGLIPDVRGMHIPASDLRDIPKVLSLKRDGGVLDQEGVVEVISSLCPDGQSVERDLTWGVYVVVSAKTEYVRQVLRNYGVYIGGEKNALIYRPNHLCGLETPVSIANIVLRHESTGSPIGHFSEVISVAKKSLKPGDWLDGEGGYTVYGLIEKEEIAREENLLPMGLASKVCVKRVIEEDEPISYNDVELDEDSFGLKLRRLQDAAL